MKNKIGIILVFLIFLMNLLTILFLFLHGKDIKSLSLNTYDIARQLEIDLNY